MSAGISMAGVARIMPNHPRVHLNADTYRIIPSHFPPISLFEDVLEPSELDAAYALESLTNDRLQDEAGNILLVEKHDRVVGEGSTPIMAAFTHIGIPSRFTEGDYGVYYAGLQLETAVTESAFSRARFLAATAQYPQTITMRCYKCSVDAELVDARLDNAVHNATSFIAGQQLGKQLKHNNEHGTLYRSVRHTGGECVAILRPIALVPPAIQTAHFQFVWDGKSITDILTIERFGC